MSVASERSNGGGLAADARGPTHAKPALRPYTPARAARYGRPEVSP